MLYRSDLISGAIIASVVERAKGTAIKRAIAAGTVADVRDPTGAPDGISENDLQAAFNAEFTENDIFPPNDVDGRLVQADRLRSGKRGQDRTRSHRRGWPARRRARVRRDLSDAPDRCRRCLQGKLSASPTNAASSFPNLQ